MEKSNIKRNVNQLTHHQKAFPIFYPPDGLITIGLPQFFHKGPFPLAYQQNFPKICHPFVITCMPPSIVSSSIGWLNLKTLHFTMQRSVYQRFLSQGKKCVWLSIRIISLITASNEFFEDFYVLIIKRSSKVLTNY